MNDAYFVYALKRCSHRQYQADKMEGTSHQQKDYEQRRGRTIADIL